jgi:hypothetical protein
VNYPLVAHEILKFMIHVFSTVISSKCLNGFAELIFNHATKILKYGKHFTFGFQQIQSSSTRFIINKSDKIFETFLGFNGCITPNIGVHQLKACRSVMCMMRER